MRLDEARGARERQHGIDAPWPRKTVRVEKSQGTSLGFKDHILQVVDVGASAKQSRSEELEGLSVHFQCFGADTARAGWRFGVTEGTEIPLNSTGLRLLCVLPEGGRTTALLRIRAMIDVRNALDRWVTTAFRSKHGEIETALEIG